MFSRLFNHVNVLQKGVDVAMLRQEVISHNIANAETPGYKSRHVLFESAFGNALARRDELALKTSSSRHFTLADPDPLAVTPLVVSETWHTARMDGGNVDPDQEMAELAMNTIQYNTLIEQLNRELARLKTAIRGQ
ncbi:MAG: flagellar basal body rod protein FlgB [Oscillospiraceae bacterium]|nr:flagellar basal body rod protein FlgB [Oscillospiraceae bacterium]